MNITTICLAFGLLCSSTQGTPALQEVAFTKAPSVIDQNRTSHIEKAATTCFKSGEQTSGMNKICYYNCLGSQAAITISAVAICPLSIKR